MTTATVIDELLAEGAVTVSQATTEFGLGRSRLYEWMQSGQIPYSQVGAKRLIPRRALKRLLAAGMVGADMAAK